MADDSSCRDLAGRCERSGVVDVLVFRRVSTTTWAHLGGLGRGRSWAGVVEVGEDEPLLAGAIGTVTLMTHPVPSRVIGPYYAVGAAAVRLSNDVLVVLANPNEPLSEQPEDVLRQLAECLDGDLDEISPSKRLGDELEVLHAVRAVITTPAMSVSETLTHVIGVATDALSCEIGVVRDGAGRIAARGTDLGEHDLLAALDELEARAGGRTYCVQDSAAVALPSPLDAAHGVLSLLAVPLPEPLGGLLVAAHTGDAPRGFTNLCRRLGEQVADTAGVIAHTAVLRENLLDLADEQFRTARTDALTGLGNRMCWEEALSAAQDRVDSGASIAVITVDVDGLKEVNDTYGHDEGDALLRRCADVLREHSRGDDVLCRIGGDEFALLLPVGPSLATERVAALTRRFAGPRSCRQQVAASVGLGIATAGGRVLDAVRDADSAMYVHKNARREDGVSAHPINA
jgi:diguanylate cyclase (GGDEF)-like protein